MLDNNQIQAAVYRAAYLSISNIFLFTLACIPDSIDYIYSNQQFLFGLDYMYERRCQRSVYKLIVFCL